MHVAKMEKHFPGHVVRETDAMRRRDYAPTAKGQKLFNQSEFDVVGECDGVSKSLGFTSMDVDIPVASGHHFNCFDAGGKIIDRSNGTKVRFIEMEGVYFLNIKNKSPGSSSVGTSGFTRPGP